MPTLEDLPDDEAAAPKVLQLAIVGRPNVGKSTLINALLGEERLLTGPEAGITRDAIAVDWHWKGTPIRLIDTAGLRRRARVVEKLERLSGADTDRAVRYAHVVVLVLDANDMLEKQDLTIARHVIDEGRALVIAANKWDAIEDKNEALKKLKDRVEKSLPQVTGLPVVTLVGALRPQPRQADAGGLQYVCAMEQARADRATEPLPRSGDGGASAAAGARPAHQAALYDPDQDPAADLRPVRRQGRRSAGRLCAVSRSTASASAST